MEKKDIDLIDELNKKMEKIIFILDRKKVVELADLLGNRRKLMYRNFISGIYKGIGIGIGVTIMTALLIFILQKMVTLNIPIIGEFIADIVDIVNNNIN